MNNLIEKIKESGLTGRSGSGFPVWRKWQTVQQAVQNYLLPPQDKSRAKAYVICNASEGEPQARKDHHILTNFAPEIVEGIELALEALPAQTAYIYINKNYYREFKSRLVNLTHSLPIELFEKPEGYLSGEETVLINNIEGKYPPEPRQKPPFPTEYGLWGKPTLINNVETFYWVSKIAKNQYKKERFFQVVGEAENPGVFLLPENLTYEQILKQTNNWPKFDFFLQCGGWACGQILLPQELSQPVKGLGLFIIYDKNNTDVLNLMRKWAQFYLENNCDKCAPCREGIYRIFEMLFKAETPRFAEKIEAYQDKKVFDEIFDNLTKASMCPLGRIAVAPFKTAIEKLF